MDKNTHAHTKQKTILNSSLKRPIKSCFGEDNTEMFLMSCFGKENTCTLQTKRNITFLLKNGSWRPIFCKKALKMFVKSCLWPENTLYNNQKVTLHFDVKRPIKSFFAQLNTSTHQTKTNFTFQNEKALKVMFWTRKHMHTPNKKGTLYFSLKWPIKWCFGQENSKNVSKLMFWGRKHLETPKKK